MDEIVFNEISIRLCTSGDVDTLLTLSAQTFKDTFEAANTEEDMKLYLQQNFTKERLQSELDDSASTFMLALDDTTPAGYVKLRINNTPKELNGKRALEVERLYAAKAYIGKQVGKKLMQASVEHALQNNFSIVWLGVWEHNSRAKAFYEKHGFKKFSTHIFKLGNDSQTDWLMKRELNYGALTSV